MNSEVIYRRGTLADVRGAQRVFRHALYDLLYQKGRLDRDRPSEQELIEDWDVRGSLYQYLTAHADQYWVAEQAGEVVGYARSVRHQDVRELTEFFVSPDVQSAGVGRTLISKVMPSDHGTTDFVMATDDVRAQVRYIKAGMQHQFLIYEMAREPQTRTLSGRLVAQSFQAEQAALDKLAEIDQAVIGFRRDHQHHWLLQARSGFFYQSGDDIIGYGYVGLESGPFAALDNVWYPDILAHAETESAWQGREKFLLGVPTINQLVLHYCLEQGYQIDPFFNFFLSSQDFGRFDRYLVTEPALIL